MTQLHEIHPALAEIDDIDRQMMKVRASKPQRIYEAFEKAAGYTRINEVMVLGETPSRYKVLALYSMFYLKKNLEHANDRLYNALTSKTDEFNDSFAVHDEWSLILEPTLIRVYYYFGSKGNGSLEARVEKVLLDFLWEKMLYKNDIHQSKESTWWMVASENHDINAKACALITSQIFMDLPDYQNRVYPDKGCGGGTGFWFHYMYTFMNGNKESGKGPEGRRSAMPSGNYTAKDHYAAWVDYWMRYISERARKGFFLEVSASGYMKFTLSFLSLIQEFCQDEKLKNRSKYFFDLIWAEWAQDQIGGRRGGAKTRHVFNHDITCFDAMYHMSAFLLGAEGDACDNYYFQLLSDYELPEIVWDLIYNRKDHEPYEYISRKPGEEEPVYPRPLGTERTLLCDTPSRLLRYSYITTDYIIGTQMDHPMAIQSHLSTTKRHHEVKFATSPDAYIYPTAFEENEEGDLIPAGVLYRSVQHKDILISQQAFGFTQVNPEWFPHPRPVVHKYGLHFGKTFENFIEKGGWLFIKEGNGFLAVRPAFGDWHKYKIHSYILDDAYAPIIMHTGSHSKYCSLDQFIDTILSNTLEINDIVSVGYNTVTYRTTDGVEIYFNAANNEPPMVNGMYIDYAPSKTYDSPYISGDYGDPVITVSNGDKKLVLDFT